MPAKTDDSSTTRSRVLIADSFLAADRGRLLRDVDPDRAPRDASAAADAAARAELVVPRGELVGHPLAVAGAPALTDAAAVHVRVVERQAAVPDPLALNSLSGQVGGILHADAEAGGANERAVAAGEATIGDLVPARMLEVLEDVLLQAFGVECPAHARPCVLDQRMSGVPVGGVRVPVRDLSHHIGAALASDPNEEPVL